MFAPLPREIERQQKIWWRVPYRDGGRDLSGWDCWGVVVYVGREIFGQAHQEFAGVVASVQDDSAVVDAIGAKLPLYEECAAGAGAVTLLKSKGLPLHVGLLLAPRIMLHALQEIGTLSTDLAADPRWANRVIGHYRLKV